MFHYMENNDLLYRFVFEETYDVNSLVLRAKSFKHAFNQAVLILGESTLRNHLLKIQIIN